LDESDLGPELLIMRIPMETPDIPFLCHARMRRLWWAVASAATALMAASLVLRPHTPTASWDSVFPVIALAGLLGMILCNSAETATLAWLSSCVCLAGALATSGFAIGLGPAWWFATAMLLAAYIVPTARRIVRGEPQGAPPVRQSIA
jgi:hypothetical protein